MAGRVFTTTERSKINMEKSTKKQEHVREFTKYGPVDTGEIEIVLPLDAFFEWADSGSIGYNLSIAEPYIPVFYETFKRIRDMDEIEEIFVRIMDTNEGQDEDWFSSDTVYVIGTLPKEKLWEIMKAVKPDIHPDDIVEGWLWAPPVNLPSEIPASKVLSMWWD